MGDSKDLALGEVGRLLSSDSTGSHVRWNTGVKKGSISLVHNDDLVPFKPTAGSAWEDVDEGLETGTLVSVSVRSVVDAGGVPALLNTLVVEGHLSTFGPVVDEAISLVASRLRTDPSMLEVLAELEEDEREALVYRAAQTLLHSAFSD